MPRLPAPSSLLLPLLLAVGRASAEACLEDPTQAPCSSFEYPSSNSTSDMDSLCMMMPYMTGCSIRTLCTSSHDHHGDPYCDPFSLVADVCAEDMPGMSGCASYVALCHPEGTLVPQCSSLPPVPELPTTAEANTAIKAMCAQHFMVGCDECDLSSPGFMDCDLLGVYSRLCLSMPSMAECAAWSAMCEAEGGVGGWGELCPSSDPGADQPPLMRMYFHTGIKDYILFESWVPRSSLGYAFSLIAVMAMAVSFEALQSFRAFVERRWAVKLASDAGEDTKQASFLRDIQKAALHVVEIGLGYFLMLIAMTFNMGLFLSLLGGFFLGHLLFGRFRSYVAKPSCC